MVQEYVSALLDRERMLTANTVCPCVDIAVIVSRRQPT